MSAWRSDFLSSCLHDGLLVCLFVYLAVSLCVSVSICMSACLSSCHHGCLLVCLRVYMYVCLSLCLLGSHFVYLRVPLAVSLYTRFRFHLLAFLSSCQPSVQPASFSVSLFSLFLPVCLFSFSPSASVSLFCLPFCYPCVCFAVFCCCLILVCCCCCLRGEGAEGCKNGFS